MPLTTNRNHLVKIGVGGEVWPPVASERGTYRVSSAGWPIVVLGMGGIVYNVRVGDRASGWAGGDHVEPAVSIKAANPNANSAVAYLTCLGNEVVVTSGWAKGARGVITGKHGRVMADFSPDVLVRLCPGDRVLIRAFGKGLEIDGYPDVKVLNCDPDLLEAMDPQETGDGSLQVKVVAEVPGYLFGSGQEVNPEQVDTDLMTHDPELIARLGLDKLRLGDLVAMLDEDHTWGRGYRRGAVTIGCIIHGDSPLMGHGLGTGTLLTSSIGKLSWTIDPSANVDTYLRIRAQHGDQ